MRVLILCLVTIYSTNAMALESPEDKHAHVCEISFTSINPCFYEGISVNLLFNKIAADEISLQQLRVIYNGKSQTLKITPNTSLFQGDKGFISISDINFDNIPDIAITTSFGLANLYLDYWVFNVNKNLFEMVGNYAEFNIDRKNKILSHKVKINAQRYEYKQYSWQAYKLNSQQ